MKIIPVNEMNLAGAAAVHAASWRESHREICSPEFVAAHTTQRQMDYLRKELEQGKQVFLLLDPEPVGVVSVHGDLIENLYVLPEAERRGYGTALLDHACGLCGVPALWVLSTNGKAREFYEHRGFGYTGRQKRLNDRLAELEMKKDG